MRIFIIVVGFVVLISANAWAQDQCHKNNAVKNDGECWVTISAAQKNMIVRGVWVGTSVQYLATDLVDQQPKFGSLKRWAQLPSSTTIGDIVDYFDALYKTPANRSIGWDWAYLLAGMNARDDDSDDRLSALRLIRQKGFIPTYGVLVGVKSADTVIVRHDKESFDVKLDGLTTEGMTPEQKVRAENFLRGLLSMGWLTCSSPSSPNAVLIYKDHMFQGDNRLSAVVKLQQRLACDGQKSTDLGDIRGIDGDTFDVNYALRRLSLVKTDKFTDPKWPDEVVKRRAESEWIDAIAAQDKIYLSGSGRHPTAEKLIEMGARKK